VIRVRNLMLFLMSLGLLSGGGPACATEPSASGANRIVLRMGDQKGGNKSVLEAAGELGNLPYRLEWSEFAAAAPLLEALNAAAIDAGFVGDAPLIFAQAAGVPVKVIGATRSNPEGTAIIAAETSPLTAASDLKGRKIATGKGSIGHFLVLASLARAGLAVSDVRLVFLSPAEAKAALASGTIDAWSTWEPYTALAEIADHASIIVDGRGLSSGLSYVIAHQAAIGPKHAALDDYLHRLGRAQLWALSHADQYAKIWASLIGVPEAVARRAFERRDLRMVPIDETVIADQQRVADTYAGAGVIPAHIDVSPGFDRSFAVAGEPDR
jgi:sulfonate transport system substrate-binding protein